MLYLRNGSEVVFKTDWSGRGVDINDIVIVVETLEGLAEMYSLDEASGCVGLGMNLGKTKVMFNEHALSEPAYVNAVLLKVMQEYIYLGQTIQIDWQYY